MPEDMSDRMPEDMPEDLPVRKCINVMVGITRSKVIFANQRENFLPLTTDSCRTNIFQSSYGVS